MNLRMKYFGQIAEIVGKEEEIIKANSSTLKELLALIGTSYPEVDSNLFATFINSKKVTDINHSLSDHDEVCLMPPFAGG